MTDTHTIDLFKIHHDAVLLQRLHLLQSERLAERALTAGTRPTGMRLSCADPVRRVKAALDPWWSLTIDEGVGMRGHLLEDYLEVALFHSMLGQWGGISYSTQVPIQWHEHGRSAFDFVVDGFHERVISCKSSIRGGAPTSSNVEQECRMMSLAGYPPESEFDIWIVNPSTMRAEGPFTFTLDEHHIEQARDELAAVSAAYAHFAEFDDPTTAPEWNDPTAWILNWNLESSSGAFRYEIVDASAAVERRNRLFLRARARASEAKREADDAKALILPFVREQLELQRAAGVAKPVVRAYSGDVEASYTIDKRGTLRVSERAFEANDAPVDDARNEVVA